MDLSDIQGAGADLRILRGGGGGVILTVDGEPSQGLHVTDRILSPTDIRALVRHLDTFYLKATVLQDMWPGRKINLG